MNPPNLTIVYLSPQSIDMDCAFRTSGDVYNDVIPSFTKKLSIEDYDFVRIFFAVRVYV